MATTRTSLIGAAVALGCTLLVMVRVVRAPGPPVLLAATPAERLTLAKAIAAAEPDWTTETSQNFPADNWSQRDDFSGREYRKVQSLAKEKHVRIKDILRAVDEDIHRVAPRTVNGQVIVPERHAAAVPCKPRPFYD